MITSPLTPPQLFRSLNSAGDWNFGFGLASYLTEQAAIVADIQTALQTFWNDAFWETTFGVDWINLLGTTNSQNMILLQTRSIILSRAGVVAINAVSSNFNPQTRVLVLTYNITTIYSQNAVNSVNIPVGPS